MKALAVTQQGELELIEIQEPKSTPDRVLIRTDRVGICATDREMVRSKSIYTLPSGDQHLVLGHEGLGTVIEVGSEVTSDLRVGDRVVPVAYTNRHTHRLGKVKAFCRLDMCPDMLEKRRGINAHGFFREYLAEAPNDLIRVPDKVGDAGVLLEPLTVSLKGLRDAFSLRQRWLLTDYDFQPEEFPQRTLVVGAGPIGMLGIILARTYGWETVAVDLVDEGSQKAQIIDGVGASYINGRDYGPEDILERFGEFDIMVEAVQEPKVLFDYSNLLALNGVFVVLGWSAEEKRIEIDGAKFVRDLLTKHGTILSSVGASDIHYLEGIERLLQMRVMFGNVLDRLVTSSYQIEEFSLGFAGQGAQEIKTVLEFGER